MNVDFFFGKIASRLNDVIAFDSHRILCRNSICFVEYINPSDINSKCTYFSIILRF